MPRKPANPLSRYAPVDEYQAELADKYTPILAHPEPGTANWCWAAGELAMNVYNDLYLRRGTDVQTEIIRLSWRKAITESLCRFRCKQPNAVAEKAYALGYQLHVVSAWMVNGNIDKSTDLERLVERYATRTTWRHFAYLPTLASLIVDRSLAYGGGSLPNPDLIGECCPGDDVGSTAESAISAA